MDGASWIRIGAVAGALAVICGAFGAHGLAPSETELEAMAPSARKDVLRRLDRFETAARYHLIHSLAIVAVGTVVLATGSRPSLALSLSGWAFLLGVAIFSGTLYGIGLGGPKWLGAITPIGGVSLIVGWSALAIASFAKHGPS